MSSNANKKSPIFGNSDPKKQNVFVDGDPALEAEEGYDALEQNLKPQKLAYLTEMLLQLKKLAGEIDEPMTVYLIEMAYLEASTAQSVGEFDAGLKD